MLSTKITADENLGHTIQVDFKEGSTTLAGGKIYSSKQFHFLTPSEHLIDGMTFPMEMHVVNVLMDSNAHEYPRYVARRSDNFPIAQINSGKGLY